MASAVTPLGLYRKRPRRFRPLDTGLHAGEAGDLARYPRFRAPWRGSRCLSGK